LLNADHRKRIQTTGSDAVSTSRRGLSRAAVTSANAAPTAWRAASSFFYTSSVIGIRVWAGRTPSLSQCWFYNHIWTHDRAYHPNQPMK